MSVDRAFIVGFTPRFVMEYIIVDRFVTPLPVVKKLTTKSSIESVNYSIKPLSMPGISSGSITFCNACDGVAPRS